MFEPFQDRNPHFFGTVSLSWFVMKSISKTYSFNLFWSKSLRKSFFGGHFSIFAGFWNKFTFKIGCFTLTFRVKLLKRLNLKTLQSKIIIFKNMCEFFREKSQIVVLSTFYQRELIFFKYFDKNVYSVQKRVKNALFRTLYTFSSK